MATTFGSVSVSLSHRLGDVVDAAGDSGESYSSAFRLQMIHEGQKTLWNFFYQNFFYPLLVAAYDGLTDVARPAYYRRISQFLPSQIVSTDNSIYALSGLTRMSDIVSVFNESDQTKVNMVPYNDISLRKTFVSRFYPSILNQVGYIDAGDLIVEPNRGAVSLNICYIKLLNGALGHVDNLEFDDGFVPDIITLAEAHVYQDNGEVEKAAAMINKVLMNYMPQPQGVAQ